MCATRKSRMQARARKCLPMMFGAVIFLSGPVAAQDITAASIEAMDFVPLSSWKLPEPRHPKTNPYRKERVELGKKLFFDPLLSGNGKMSCATCHNPNAGWSDGLATARGHEGKVLARATPTIVNVAYNTILMWDGRAPNLEKQALGPVTNPDEMANTRRNLLKTLRAQPEYVAAFEKAYPGIGITRSTVERSLAMYQRTIVSRNSPFDRWVAGDEKAVSANVKRGYLLFVNPDKGNCAICHQPPSFTDNGFHNIGLASYGSKNPDQGRYKQRKVPVARGAFKTPQLRNISETAPYFHDGSARTLEDVVRHYAKGGVATSNLSPNMRIGKLTDQEIADLVAFLKSLTGRIGGKNKTTVASQ